MLCIGIYAGVCASKYADNYSSKHKFINNNLHLDLDGMQESDGIEHNIDIRRPLVIRALRRSNVRKKIADYLFDISPSSSYTSEIAYNVKTTPTNVIGAIRGMESRYKEDESLLGLGLVEEKKGGKNIKLYALTSFGKEVVESYNKKK